MFCISILAACGNDTSPKESKPTVQENAENTSENETEELNPNEESSLKKDTSNEDKLKNFEEYSYLNKEIPNLNELEAIIETDNPNKRVILYQEGNQKKEYKSIFIKNQKRLKIIHLNKDGEIFNNIID